MDEFGKVYLTHHGRHDMTVLQMEIIVGTVEVSGHDSDIVGAVLQVITLAHLQSGNLRNGIFLVGVFQRGGQQTVFPHGLGAFFG